MSLAVPELVLGMDVDILVRSPLLELHAIASTQDKELEEERCCSTSCSLSEGISHDQLDFALNTGRDNDSGPYVSFS